MSDPHSQHEHDKADKFYSEAQRLVCKSCGHSVKDGHLSYSCNALIHYIKVGLSSKVPSPKKCECRCYEPAE